jgi:hypothetical protein
VEYLSNLSCDSWPAQGVILVLKLLNTNSIFYI